MIRSYWNEQRYEFEEQLATYLYPLARDDTEAKVNQWRNFAVPVAA